MKAEFHLPASVSSRSPHLDELTQVKRDLRQYIALIGQNDPILASELSRRVSLCDWTPYEIHSLRSLGLPIPVAFCPNPGLPGGGPAELAIDIIKGFITIALEGNKNSVQQDLERKIVKATILLPDGSIEVGSHQGGRVLSDPKKNRFGFNPRYTLLAAGQGEFTSARVTYIGNFHNNHFHDITGRAQYFIEGTFRYRGCFTEGKRSGHGELEKYNPETKSFYLYFKGDWKEDKPYDGNVHTPDGGTLTIKEGVIIGMKGQTIVTPSPQLPKPANTTIPPPPPPATYEALVERKLANPTLSLTLEESIHVLTHCIQHGKAQAQKAQGKDLIILIGNTGAGKSTLANRLSGCTLEVKKPKELGLKGLTPVIVVKPCSQGGTLDEVMPIGHSNQSKTFMPQVETDRTGNTYCDCPGFLDNRGSEINIANAVNIKNTLAAAKSVKAIILINYHSLLADRARGLREMFQITCDLFGSPDRLVQHKASLLIGITNVPLDQDLETLQEFVGDSKLPIMQELSERLFIYDPLDRPLEGAKTREQLLETLSTLPPIEQPRNIFNTVLTDQDTKTLIDISEQISQRIQTSLQKSDYSQAAHHLSQLQELSIIDHVTIERLLSATLLLIEREFREKISQLKSHCQFQHFTQAEGLLNHLKENLTHFPLQLHDHLDLPELENYYKATYDQYRRNEEEKETYRAQLKKAGDQIEEFIHLLDEQKKSTEAQLRVQEANFKQMMQEMEQNIQETLSSYETMKQNLGQEMNHRLTQKEEEIKALNGHNEQLLQEKLSQEKAKLAAEYIEKQKKLLAEKEAYLAEQEAQRKEKETRLAEQKEKLTTQIQAIETEKAQKVSQQKELEVPSMAFGPADWEKYFGEVDPAPPLPANIEEILNSPCHYWPDKKVRETHLLFYVPSRVNGQPLTLGTLSELIQKPKGGGHAMKYSYFTDTLQAEHGSKGTEAHWTLMTRDVVPNSRKKPYKDQRALAKGSDEPPHLLEASVGILMHHARSGERLFGQNPVTYTRCQEKIQSYQTSVGELSNGLFLRLVSRDYDVDGLAFSRKF